MNSFKQIDISNKCPRNELILKIDEKKYIASADIDVSANQNDFYSAKLIYVYNKLSSFLNRALNLCTDESCPVMKTLRGEYAWKDERTNVVSKISAHAYISNLMAYIQDKLENKSIFPTDGNYNNTFNKIYNEISRRLVRLFHHFYDYHIDGLKNNNCSEMFFDCYREFYLFTLRNNVALEDNPSTVQLNKYIIETYLDESISQAKTDISDNSIVDPIKENNVSKPELVDTSINPPLPSSLPADHAENKPKEQPKPVEPKPVQPKKSGGLCWYIYVFIIGCCSNIL